jgi:FdhD protein
VRLSPSGGTLRRTGEVACVKSSLDRALPSNVSRVVTFEGATRSTHDDRLAGEEPLEIRIGDGSTSRSLAMTMRTPGHDFELAAGFLFCEGLIAEPSDVRSISYCTERELDREQQYNIVTVELTRRPRRDVASLERHFLTTSACGVCGRATLESLHERGLRPVTAAPRIEPKTLFELPKSLREQQRIFDATGGLHAAALFGIGGELQAVREDIGRHNALDKLVGMLFLEGRLPIDEGIVIVSGRASYELVQKAISAGAPVLCAVSAPSNLAVALAREFGVTLVGFLRGERFNVYSGEERIAT